jgi:hypothetical protein
MTELMGMNDVVEGSYQPVVVRRPRARDGLGFRALGMPADDTGITNNVAHAGVTSFRGSSKLEFASRAAEREVWGKATGAQASS